MAWGRGLFRIWVVASVLWAIGALIATDAPSNARKYFFEKVLPIDVSGGDIELSNPIDGIVTATYGGKSYTVDTNGVTPEMADDWLRVKKAVAKLVNQNAAVNNADIRIALRDLMTAVSLAVAVPLAVLAIGASFIWAGRGFRG